jgi:hypothetical protein
MKKSEPINFYSQSKPPLAKSLLSIEPAEESAPDFVMPYVELEPTP